MTLPQRLIVAFGLAAALATSAARADEPKFFYEIQPAFDNCGDDSLARARKDGITLGVSQIPPEEIIDEKTKEISGIDWDVIKGVLDWLGVKTLKTEILPWEAQVPSLLSKRTDIMPIHVNPERTKVLSFTGPAYWYGPVIVVTKGNPLGIKSYDDLKNRKVGSISGGAADFYLRRIGVTTTPFKSQIEELQSLNQGRLEAVLEDDITYLEFIKSNPTNQLEPLWSIGVPDDLINGGGYGMTRYGMRKEDCSLRVAFTGALAEMRANGAISHILKKYGLNDRNLSMYKMSF
jgi:polar amino acid transport system substrate-binding protein